MGGRLLEVGWMWHAGRRKAKGQVEVGPVLESALHPQSPGSDVPSIFDQNTVLSFIPLS